MAPWKCQDPLVGTPLQNLFQVCAPVYGKNNVDVLLVGSECPFKPLGTWQDLEGIYCTFYMESNAALSSLSVWIRLYNFQKVPLINSSEERKWRLKVIVLLWIMGKEVQTVPNTRKHSYLFTATAFSKEHEIRPVRYFRGCTCSFVSLFSSFHFPFCNPPRFFFITSTTQSICSNWSLDHFNTAISNKVFASGAFADNPHWLWTAPGKAEILYFLAFRNQHSEKTENRPGNLPSAKVLAFCHWMCKMNKQA